MATRWGGFACNLQKALPVSATWSNGRLEIGGCAIPDLAARHGTPLIVIDRKTLISRARAYVDVLDDGCAYYGSKAFPSVAICELLAAEGMGIDVCTEGELAVALRAGVDPEQILFHGNNKSTGELRFARDAGLGHVVVDSFDEIARLRELGATARLLVRVTPDVTPETHRHIQTGGDSSKFGFQLGNGDALEAVRRITRAPELTFAGLHTHVGSQMRDLTAPITATVRIAEFAAAVWNELSVEVGEVNLGGGLGIAYTADDEPVDVGAAAAEIRASAETEFTRVGLPVPRILMEPGRSVVGPAGVTVYTVGTVKRSRDPAIVAVDGGMSDNIRPALYSARYEVLLANRAASERVLRSTVVGKHCESGDVVVPDIDLPADVEPGDVLAVPATGAYTYSMASNYNRMRRPAVLLVDDGNAVEIVRRETIDDLLRLDRRLAEVDRAETVPGTLRQRSSV